MRTPEEKAARRTAGAIGDAIDGLLAYSPELERGLGSTPAIPMSRSSLQDSSGRFLFKPEDDGTLTAGTFTIDSLGRFV